MQKPRLVRAIYDEIRRGIPHLAAGEALKLAHRFLLAYTSERAQEEFGREVEGRALGRLPLDQAWKDGGWLIWDYEARRASEHDHLDSSELAALRPAIERYLGPEWQHHSQVRPLLPRENT